MTFLDQSLIHVVVNMIRWEASLFIESPVTAHAQVSLLSIIIHHVHGCGNAGDSTIRHRYHAASSKYI